MEKSPNPAAYYRQLFFETLADPNLNPRFRTTLTQVDVEQFPGVPVNILLNNVKIYQLAMGFSGLKGVVELWKLVFKNQLMELAEPLPNRTIRTIKPAQAGCLALFTREASDEGMLNPNRCHQILLPSVIESLTGLRANLGLTPMARLLLPHASNQMVKG